MRTVMIAVLAAAAVLAPPANAAAKKYTSCDKLLVVYPSGVARDPAAADAAQAAGMNRPTVNRGTYKANAGRLDRDRDGVACEQPA
jgi:hypothetical protein